MSKELIVRDEATRAAALLEITELNAPFTVSIRRGASRTSEQNRLQFLWFNEISKHFGDRSPEEVRAFCKLQMGVPIMREEEWFRERYDRCIKPQPYRYKLKLMEGEFMPVTSLMTTEQHARYLDEIFRQFSEEGVKLTLPEQR